MNSFEKLSTNNEEKKPLEMEQENSLESLSDQIALETSAMEGFFSKLRTKKMASFLVGVSLLTYQNVHSFGSETKSKNFTTTYSAFSDKRKKILKMRMRMRKRMRAIKTTLTRAYALEHVSKKMKKYVLGLV